VVRGIFASNIRVFIYASQHQGGQISRSLRDLDLFLCIKNKDFLYENIHKRK
jgi:hypothetical protein